MMPHLTDNNKITKNKISVITPVLNGAEHIEQTIQSVRSQRTSDFTLEYIVIDGGSTDGTVEIIQKYESEIDCWISEPDEGISDAFNKGIQRTTGDIIGIINADDWYESDTLQVLNDVYSENPEYDIFYGKTLFVKPEAGEPRPFSPLAHAGLLHDMSVTHPAVFVTRKTYELHGTFNKKYRLAMDYDFLLRAMWQGAKFKFIDRHFSNFRMEGVSVRYYQESLVECSRIRKSVFVDKK